MPKNRRFCPNCGSTNVEPDTRHTNVLGEMLFNQNKWLCNDCGYTGIMPEPSDEEVEAEEVEFEPSEQPTIDTAAGKAYLKYILYVAVPAVIIYAIFLLIFE